MLAPQKSFFNDIVNSERLHPIFTFVRNSEGSYFNKDGLLVFAPSQIPRVEFDPITRKCLGVKVEPTATNYLLDSRINDIKLCTTSLVSSNQLHKGREGSPLPFMPQRILCTKFHK